LSKVKTTIEIPDSLFRRAKILAAKEGATLRELIAQALQAELDRREKREGEPAWMRHVGGARKFAQTDIINAAVDEAFGQVDDEIWK